MNAHWLTVAEIADQIKLSRPEVRKVCASGELKASDISNGKGLCPRYRVKQTDLDRWMASRQVAA